MQAKRFMKRTVKDNVFFLLTFNSYQAHNSSPPASTTWPTENEFMKATISAVEGGQ